MKYYLKALIQYADFSNRIRRKEYWVFMLLNIFILVLLMIIERQIITAMSGYSGYGLFSLPYLLFVIIPTLAATVRRLHDIGLSGWWLICPVVCFTTLKPGDLGQNSYGISPKEELYDHI